MGKIKVTQTRSYIKRPENQKRTLKALGLKNIGHSVEHDDSAAVLGMIDKVAPSYEIKNPILNQSGFQTVKKDELEPEIKDAAPKKDSLVKIISQNS